ncbi:MAG: disulfide oxidoreductase [Clostridia bacterium]
MKRESLVEQAFFLSWAVSVIATLGSLYFSEVLQYIPCELCWFQRILMYPIAILLGMAYIRKDYKMSLYGMVLAVIGGSISIYHYLVQKVPAMQELGKSCGIIPCNTDYINWLGFITIPFLALIAFVLIAVLNFYIWKQVRGK